MLRIVETRHNSLGKGFIACKSLFYSHCFRMSDIITRRQRMPWYWPDFVYNYFGEGREHNRSLKILHSFTESVSINVISVHINSGQGCILIACVFFFFFSCHTGDLWEGGVHPLHWVRQWIRSGDEKKTGFLGHAVENNRWGWEKVNSQRYPGGSGHLYVWGRNCYNIFMLECCYIPMAWFQLAFLQHFAGSWHYSGCHELGHTLVRFPSWSPKKGTTRTIWGFWCVKPNCASYYAVKHLE